MNRTLLVALAVAALPAASLAQQGNPFQPPRAQYQYAPDRTFDLLHVAVKLDIDYPNRRFSGSVTNTLAALRKGLKSITLHAGEKLQIERVWVDGLEAKFTRDGAKLNVVVPSTIIGKSVAVRVDYASEKANGAGFGGGEGGWHWINQGSNPDKYRVGFWTQGESIYNRNWAPTWDYPNDFATSETITTVQKDWTVVGNGSLISEKVDGDKKTFHWKMKLPHATYLLSLVGGPFDVKKDKWQDRELWYVVPKGMGNLIDDSFGDTKDMLTFYSERFGYKYAWPKYAQNAMYDFGGGMENVSATTLGMGSLTDKREGYYNMSGLNSHELGHQWFGDTVSCKDWGHIWLNESWATYAQNLYFQHARGDAEYDRQIEGDMRGYFQEARRYKRPIATNLYSNPDAMFDSHTYPKGASVLHTFRRYMGDDAFFAGVKLYLDTNQHRPVESADFCKALTDSSGINMTQMFEQWVYKPGHPELEYDWTYDAATKSLVVNVKQVQDTSAGTPIYKIGTSVMALVNGKSETFPLELNAATNTLKATLSSKPDAVILDPNHDFLREMKHAFSAAEAPAVAMFAPNAVDRDAAMRQWIGNADAAGLTTIVQTLRADNGRFPVFGSTQQLASKKAESTRAFFLSELKHANEDRRRDAVNALANLGLQDADRAAIRLLVNDKEMYQVVLAAIRALDPVKDKDVLSKAVAIPSRNDIIKKAAEARLKP